MMEKEKLLKNRDFRAEFDELFENCSIEDMEYILSELERYGWIDKYFLEKMNER